MHTKVFSQNTVGNSYLCQEMSNMFKGLLKSLCKIWSTEINQLFEELVRARTLKLMRKNYCYNQEINYTHEQNYNRK